MAGMLVTFSLLAGVDVSYKTVERLYSDPAVEVALTNLHTLMLRRRGIHRVDLTGDGTGFALSITQHYATTATKEKEQAKANPPAASNDVASERKVRRFVYSFRLLDLRTWLYVAYGTSARSEREAYEAALRWMEAQGIQVDSIRLDRLYSLVSDAERFRGAAFYIIPRKDSKIHVQHEWLEALRSFVERPVAHLEEYYRREHSEAGFSSDKRMLGWQIAQRRTDRINTADRCHSTWHNLLNLYGPDRGSLSGSTPR
jgi:transposase